MEKIDFKKLMKPFWSPPVGRFSTVEVPRLQFAMIDGDGDPNTAPTYKRAVEWLYSVSYAIKFHSKAAGRDYGVAPLEGLWWSADMTTFLTRAKDQWSWTMMIMQPDWVSADIFEAGGAKAAAKLGTPPATLRLEALEEGLCVQTLHIGSYDDEAPVLRRLHEEFMPAEGLGYNGRHHEIYLSDPRRVAPEKLRTVLRQPVRRVG